MWVGRGIRNPWASIVRGCVETYLLPLGYLLSLPTLLLEPIVQATAVRKITSRFRWSLPYPRAHLPSRPGFVFSPSETPGIDALYPPGGTDFLVTCHYTGPRLAVLARCLSRNDHLEGPGARAVLSDVPHHLLHVIGRHRDYPPTFDLDRPYPVPARSPAERCLDRPSTGYPDGYA